MADLNYDEAAAQGRPVLRGVGPLPGGLTWTERHGDVSHLSIEAKQRILDEWTGRHDG